MKPKMKAAHFLLVPELACSPPNEAIVSALLDLNYDVHLYAPGEVFDTCMYGNRVSSYQVQYGRQWSLKNALSIRWSHYSLFSGTSEDPMAVAGLLSLVYRRPSFTLADEIKSGSYRGDASASWKNLCKWAMRRSSLNIVNDSARIELQRAYAGLPKDCEILVYPGCFRCPPSSVDRKEQRRAWGIPEDALVVCASGGFNLTSGADWIVQAIQAQKNLYALIQPLGMDPLAKFLLCKIEGNERIYVERRRLGWVEAWSSAAAVDIGMAIYLNPAPQFQKMGTSSNRLCMFLSMGVPVIASRQPSFKFIEDYDCGVLVENQIEFIEAISRIRVRLDEMKKNALRCAREYIDALCKYEKLKEAISNIGRGSA